MRTLALITLLSCVPPRPSGPVAIDVTQQAPGVQIAVAVEQNEIWHLTIRNVADDSLIVIWDESAIVGPDGTSWGRMIGFGTAPHPPSPVPPHSSLTEAILPSRYLELPWAPPSLAGVRLLVTLRRGADTLTWQAQIPR